MPVLAITDSCLCPVTAYKNMMSKVSAGQSDPAFSVHSDSKEKKLVPVTYSQFQTKLRDLISCTGREKRSFSSHSLRRGAAAGLLNLE